MISINLDWNFERGFSSVINNKDSLVAEKKLIVI